MLCACMTACAPRGVVQGATISAPESFAFSIVIPEGLGEKGQTLEPAWYMLDAGGMLRAGIGVRKFSVDGSGTKPPRIVRHVDREEREALYEVLRGASVFAVPSVGQAVGDAQATLAEQASIGSELPGSAMVGVWWTVGERRRSYVMVPVKGNRDDGRSEAAEVWAGLEHAVEVMRGWMWKDVREHARLGL